MLEIWGIFVEWLHVNWSNEVEFVNHYDNSLSSDKSLLFD